MSLGRALHSEEPGTAVFVSSYGLSMSCTYNDDGPVRRSDEVCRKEIKWCLVRVATRKDHVHGDPLRLCEAQCHHDV